MPLFNETQVGRFNDIIGRLHGKKGAPAAPTIAPEIHHSITLESDRPEFHHLAGSRLWTMGRQTSVPVNTQNVILLNPANSGVLVVLEEYTIFDVTVPLTSVSVLLTGAGATAAYAALGTAITPALRDLRYGLKQSTVVIREVDSAAVLGTIVGRILQHGAVTDPTLQQPFILPPDSAITFEAITAAHALSYQLFGRERVLQESEQLTA